MRNYTLHVLNDAGRTVRRYDFQAGSDTEATGAAGAVVGLARGELRAGARVVHSWTSHLSDQTAA